MLGGAHQQRCTAARTARGQPPTRRRNGRLEGRPAALVTGPLHQAAAVLCHCFALSLLCTHVGGHDLAVLDHICHHLALRAAALHVRPQQVAGAAGKGGGPGLGNIRRHKKGQAGQKRRQMRAAKSAPNDGLLGGRVPLPVHGAPLQQPEAPAGEGCKEAPT